MISEFCCVAAGSGAVAIGCGTFGMKTSLKKEVNSLSSA